MCTFNGDYMEPEIFGDRYQICSCFKHIWSTYSNKLIRIRHEPFYLTNRCGEKQRYIIDKNIQFNYGLRLKMVFFLLILISISSLWASGAITSLILIASNAFSLSLSFSRTDKDNGTDTCCSTLIC